MVKKLKIVQHVKIGQSASTRKKILEYHKSAPPLRSEISVEGPLLLENRSLSDKICYDRFNPVRKILAGP